MTSLVDLVVMELVVNLCFAYNIAPKTKEHSWKRLATLQWEKKMRSLTESLTSQMVMKECFLTCTKCVNCRLKMAAFDACLFNWLPNCLACFSVSWKPVTDFLLPVFYVKEKTKRIWNSSIGEKKAQMLKAHNKLWYSSFQGNKLLIFEKLSRSNLAFKIKSLFVVLEISWHWVNRKCL